MFLQSGPPIIPFSGPGDLLIGFPFHFEIVQTRDYIVIQHEELNRRIIPLDRRPHLPAAIAQWLGDSRGHWDGDTLVIETRNFREQRPYAGVVTTDHLRLVERLTRVDADTIDYRFTVEDATIWTRPWTAAVRIERSEGRIYEYACHEANYSLPHILSGTGQRRNGNRRSSSAEGRYAKSTGIHRRAHRRCRAHPFTRRIPDNGKCVEAATAFGRMLSKSADRFKVWLTC